MDIGAHRRRVPFRDVPTPGLPAAVLHEGEWWWAVRQVAEDTYILEENPLVGKRTKIVHVEPSALV